MAMAHWADQAVSTQVMWNLTDEINSYLAGMGENVKARSSEGEPAVFFEVDGGDIAQELEENDYGYDIVFEVANEDEQEKVGENIEFRIMNPNDNSREELTFTLTVEKRYVDEVDIYAVDAGVVYTKFLEFFNG